MSNICENQLTVSGLNVKAFVDQAKSLHGDGSPNPLSFENFIPVGEDYADKYWGTKADAYDADITENEETKIEYSFNTAWSPPELFALKVSAQFPQLTFTLWYLEDALQFTGESVYQNGVEVSRKYSQEPYSREYWEIAGSDPELEHRIGMRNDLAEEEKIIGYIDLGKENVLRMKAYVDAALAAPTVNTKLWDSLYATLTTSQIDKALRHAGLTYNDWMQFIDDIHAPAIPTSNVLLKALEQFADEDNWHFNEHYGILEWSAGLDHGEPWIAAQQAIKDSKEAGGMFSIEDYMIERIAEEAENQGIAELTNAQMLNALQGVMNWFQQSAGDSISTAVFNIKMDMEVGD